VTVFDYHVFYFWTEAVPAQVFSDDVQLQTVGRAVRREHQKLLRLVELDDTG